MEQAPQAFQEKLQSTGLSPHLLAPGQGRRRRCSSISGFPAAGECFSSAAARTARVRERRTPLHVIILHSTQKYTVHTVRDSVRVHSILIQRVATRTF